MMITASAPISGEVLEFLKMVFCCPVLEAYGMSETCGATTITKPDDGSSTFALWPNYSSANIHWLISSQNGDFAVLVNHHDLDNSKLVVGVR